MDSVQYLTYRYFVSNLPIRGSAEAVRTFRATEHVVAFRVGMFMFRGSCPPARVLLLLVIGLQLHF